jgi:large subunit ribosomal protein L29
MKAKQFKEMSAEELGTQLKDFKEELFNLRFQMATGQLQNPMVIKDCRKNIARVKTVIRERELKAMAE